MLVSGTNRIPGIGYQGPWYPAPAGIGYHPGAFNGTYRYPLVSTTGNDTRPKLREVGDAVLDLVVSSWLMLQLGQALQQQEAEGGGR